MKYIKTNFQAPYTGIKGEFTINHYEPMGYYLTNWYKGMSNNQVRYLHKDLSIRKLTKFEEKFNGYYKERELAEETLKRYVEKTKQ